MTRALVFRDIAKVVLGIAITVPVPVLMVTSVYCVSPMWLAFEALSFSGVIILSIFCCRDIRSFLAVMIVVAMTLSISMTNWPAKFAFAYAKPKMDELVERVVADGSDPEPQWVGLFRIRAVEIKEPGLVCLWTHTAPAGNSGFVQSSTSSIPLNINSQTSFGDQWYFVEED